MEIRRLTRQDHQDLWMKNEPFVMPGRMVPALRDGVWSHHITLFPEPQEMVFPDEPYDFDELDQKGAIFAAYEDEVCVGLAIYQWPFFRYLYLYDLKVSRVARGHGVGRALVQAGLDLAREHGLAGIYTQGQDNNLNACRFYLAVGFAIGGFDNHVYNGTLQEGKADILFYKTLDSGGLL